MYRRNAQPSPELATPPARIAYRSYAIARATLLIGFAFVAMSFVAFSFVYVTHISCSRGGEGGGVCRTASYGLWVGESSHELRLDEPMSMDVKTTNRGKNGPRATATLLRSSGPPIDLSGRSLVNRLDADSALEAQARFTAFQAEERQRTLDVWLRPPLLDMVFGVLFGLLLLAAAASIVGEHLKQLKLVEIVVDPDRRTVALGGREVSSDGIVEVEIEEGKALPWSNGRSRKPIPGYRLVVVERSGDRIAATRDFRGGPRARHERARAELTALIGLADPKTKSKRRRGS